MALLRLRRQVYLDNNATTIVSKQVRKRVNYVLKHCFGNPSSLYKVARNSAIILDDSRRQVAKAINAKPQEIYFTGSASEANNCILKSVSEHFHPDKKKIISTPIEHASVMSTLEYLQTKGIIVEFIPIDSMGRVQFDAIERMVDSDTFLICCMLANNEIGTIQDIKKISRLAGDRGILIMSDCVQGLGKIKIDIEDLGVDYASFSAHKIHGPKGVGAMFVKEGRPLSPFIHGGHQEFGMRAGTEGLHNIAGFAAACGDVEKMLERSEQVSHNKMILVDGLKRIKPDVRIHSPEDFCLPNTVSITFPGVSNAVFMAMLDYYGISVSAGSACNTQDDTPSHVLKAIGLSDEEARQTIRFSLSTETSERDIRYVISIVDDFFSGKIPPVNAILPALLNEDILLAENTYILDVRFWYDRKILKGLSNSHEATFFTFHKYPGQIPSDRNILVVCQFGYNSAIVAYYLRSKGFKNVSFLLTGLVGWKIARPDLYKKFSGENIVKLNMRR
jgi:cysteine desulfurase